MDSVIINSGFVRSIISKILNKTLKSRLGCNMTTTLNEFNVTLKNERAKVHLNIEVEMTQEELKKLLAGFGLTA